MNARLTAANARLNALIDEHRLTRRLIYRLAKLDFGSVGEGEVDNNGVDVDVDDDDSSDISPDEVRQELTADIHECLKQQQDDFELIREEIVDASGASLDRVHRPDTERDRERASLAAHVARLEADLSNAHSQFRAAQLKAKASSDAAKRRNRDRFLADLQALGSPASAADNGEEAKSKTSAAAAVATNNENASSPHRTAASTILFPRRGANDAKATTISSGSSSGTDVVAALRRTHALLSGELSRSQFAQATLAESGRALAELDTRYAGVDDLLTASRTLVSQLLRSQKSDDWYLRSALAALVATLVWLVVRRFVWGPVYLLVWLPLRAVFALGAWFFASVSGRGASSSSTALIVQPSATGKPPSYPPTPVDGEPPRRYVRVGMGGANAKKPADSESPLSDEIGRMVEENRQGQQQGEQDVQQEGQEQHEGSDGRSGKRAQVKVGQDATTVVRRGDGEALVESDEPRNPKKRMWEEKPKERDEL